MPGQDPPALATPAPPRHDTQNVVPPNNQQGQASNVVPAQAPAPVPRPPAPAPAASPAPRPAAPKVKQQVLN